ncbi:MAG TPA: hypothetical protein DIT25_04110 [Candidatus Moranbacteria bacterium]|nr:hypothetical protein [Candidatus Moranbacteria bacterium]
MIIEIQIENKQITLLLKDQDKVLDTFEFAEEKQLSERLLPSIDEMLAKNSLGAENIEKIEVKSDIGENFTSYRIAKTVAEAWNYANPKARL